MADFPEYAGKNAQTPRSPLGITKPAINPAESAAERYLDQQWRDVADSGVAATHPLSINRDSEHVTTDPYDQA